MTRHFRAAAILACMLAANTFGQSRITFGSMNNYTSSLSQTLSNDLARYNNSIDRMNKQLDKEAASQKEVPKQAPAAPQQQVEFKVPPVPAPAPMTATDFQPLAQRVAPDRMIATINVPPAYKQALRKWFDGFLAEYEKDNRKYNVASAVAFSVAVSLTVTTGKEPSEEQCNALEANLNNQLASNVRFLLMTPEEKQLIYESTIITSSFAALYHVEGTKHSDPLLRAYAQELARPIVKQWLGQ